MIGRTKPHRDGGFTAVVTFLLALVVTPNRLELRANIPWIDIAEVTAWTATTTTTRSARSCIVIRKAFTLIPLRSVKEGKPSSFDHHHNSRSSSSHDDEMCHRRVMIRHISCFLAASTAMIILPNSHTTTTNNNNTNNNTNNHIVANAAYGDMAKIELPNPYQTLVDRSNRQCLVESLGNRECLAYADDINHRLYQGVVDTSPILNRINQAIISFGEIPTLVNAKKWSQISSILTGGPAGELIRNMGLLVADLSSSSSSSSSSSDNNNMSKSRQIIAVVKKDLYAMNDALQRKDATLILKYHNATTQDLLNFINSL
jgi:hypothetical protein